MKEQVVDYETVEKTREITRCDRCGCDEETLEGNAHIAPVVVGPHLDESKRHELHSPAMLLESIDHFGVIDLCTECLRIEHDIEMDVRGVSSAQHRTLTSTDTEIATVEYPGWRKSESDTHRVQVKVKVRETETKYRFTSWRALVTWFLAGAICTAIGWTVWARPEPTSLLVAGLYASMVFGIGALYGWYHNPDRHND